MTNSRAVFIARLQVSWRQYLAKKRYSSSVFTDKSVQCGCFFRLAVTSTLSQRLLHKMTNSRAVFIARLQVSWRQYLAKKRYSSSVFTDKSVQCGCFFRLAVTSTLSQRLLHKMTNSRAVFIARLQVSWRQYLAKKRYSSSVFTDKSVQCGCFFRLAVTSTLSQRLLHRMTNPRQFSSLVFKSVNVNT